MAGSYTTGGGYEPGAYQGATPRKPLSPSVAATKYVAPPNPSRDWFQATYGRTPTMRELEDVRSQYIQQRRTALANPTTTPRPTQTSPRLSGGGGSGGGGGGGGAAAPTPIWTQAQLNAMYDLLRTGKPSPYAQLDLPDYQPYKPKPFDDSYYTGLQGSWNQAVGMDVATAQQATQNLMSWLGSNYTNAFNNPNATYATAGQAPGMDRASMERFLQQQGANPNVNAENAQAQAIADAGFGNLWRTLAGNEDQNQTNRLGAAQMQGVDAVNRINALGLGGTTGINMQRGQAKSAYDQRVEEWAREDAMQAQQIAQQEAMSNWQQGNAGIDQEQAYRNATLEAILGILPGLAGTTLAMPTASQVGWSGGQWAPPPPSTLGPRPPETPDDPHHWQQIAWDLAQQQQPVGW
jgi:hypothetical protein